MPTLVNTEMLGPAAVLVAWSMVMVVWVLVTRIPGFARAGLDMTKADPGARYADVESVMPPRVNWKAHNFNHLMEQPTVFYALVAILAIAGAGGSAVMWAWGYTAFRILHSLWQSLVNTVPVRFALFLGSNICLFALTWFALRATVL
ncbi:MAG: MAPEG family protein [Halieaceae bacterium]|jgi:hypothetical protein|nr:MAPEG family protein [Halieaceae bacterium]